MDMLHEVIPDAPTILRAMAPDVPPEGCRFGVVDTLWNGVGNPRILFDGETDMGFRTYQFLGMAPKPGGRVLLKRLGDSWVIVGAIGAPPKTIKCYTVSLAADANLVSTTPYIACSLTVPDPGYEYELMGSCCAYWICEDTGNDPVGTFTSWDMTMQNPLGQGVSRQVIGLPNGPRRGWGNFLHGVTKFTGTTLVRLMFTRTNGLGRITVWGGNTYTGMFIMQVPSSP